MVHSIEGGYEGVVRIQAAQERAQWLAYMNVVITIRALQKGRWFSRYFISSQRSRSMESDNIHIAITRLYIQCLLTSFVQFLSHLILTEINFNSIGTKSDYNW